MSSSVRPSVHLLTVPAAVCAALLALVIPLASAEPGTDSQGFVDSTARCASPDTAAAFGSTATSRVAICATSGGKYTYRGVRIRDGARLILPATQSSSGFVAENDGITYTLTSSALTVSSGSTVIRQEPMLDYHGPQTSTTPSPATSAPATSASSAPTTQPSAKPDPVPNPTPNIPPLPAEVGGSGS
ncbi:hypothetical protein [Mycolicibacterium komossense]|uniref:Protein kinase n=1 Tax=Mycolicibacterium komossense TaxID=1779 RepID=A0ABT3CEM8_9MYCO|nr:hypothetical protein [Mycolicibacterium komossense]MCV7227930.1 hypothetical protein [Mycolicibacterium komossense]